MSRMTGSLTALGAIAVAAALTVCATQIGSLTHTAPATSSLPTTLGDPALTCPGPETLEVPEGGSAVNPGGAVVVSAVMAGTQAASGTIDVAGEASSLAGAAAKLLPSSSLKPKAGRSLDLSLKPQVGTTVGAEVGALAVSGLGPVRIEAAAGTGQVSKTVASSADSPLLAAVQSTVSASGDLRGLTVAQCGESSADTWLVGGGTKPGQRLRLMLTNDAATPAVADVDVYGPEGRVEAPAGDGVAVPAHGQVPLFVDALAPDLSRVVVHVTARTGRVRAVMHDSLMRGLYPGGVDDVSGSAAPAKRQLIPGVSLLAGQQWKAGDATSAGSSFVRVAVPGSEEAVVKVSLRDASGQVQLPAKAVQNVRAGSVVDIPLDGVPAGYYTAEVDADVPVVASAQVGRRGGTGKYLASEFGWAPATDPLSGEGVVALPAGPQVTLSVASVGEAGSLTVEAITADGKFLQPKTIQVARGATVAAGVPAGSVGLRFTAFEGGKLVASTVSTVNSQRGQMVSVVPVKVTAASSTRSVAAVSERLGLR
ncbi:DUF5719 family protein [Spongisporangium articulatum]|uniref:DUF5719 family protein n=1 Tax=Spongisporangium articulatum TaxID=3362603 RepID=A0ABW8AR60_9ACTN